MLTGQDIVCISSIDWDFIWQGHQEIMSALAKQGNRVLFIENTGVRAPGLRDLSRLRHRLQNWRRSTRGFRKERENLFLYSPLILPFPYSRLARWVNRALLLRALRRWMRVMGFGRPIVWTFLPTPLASDLIRELYPALTIYYCIDDFASSSPAARRISRSESRVFTDMDLVFVTSEKLRAKASRFNRRVHLFPFGVEFDRFEQARRASDGVPVELERLPRPIVGYVGGVHQWVDQELLVSAARALPEASFVLVGPAQTDISKLAEHPNIHLLGARPHQQVPRYIKGFDVGIVPYRSSDYTDHVYPTKLNEYLAMGIPVVATDLPEIRRFNAEHGASVSIAPTVESFADAIRQALTAPQREGGAVARRIAAARQNSWDARIAQMTVLIEEEVAGRAVRNEPWQESLQRLYRAASRRAVGTVLVIAAAALLIGYSPVVWWGAEPLRMSEPPRSADAIVVLAGGVGESGKAGGGFQERVRQAVDLYRAGHAPRMIFSSGYTFVFKETEVMRELAVAQGVPSAAIILETEAANTAQNVLRVHRILTQHRWSRILLVSSPYHMRRAMLTFRKLAPDITVIPTPVPDTRFYSHRHGASAEQIQGILHEYLGLAYYRWKGWI
ncbi:MAG: hypothetical protein A3C53_08895 [Omnitrophica WOR_2 bacterium RIFCSPHIGHO2_02_FULL_68_15]|nr:MAG: hypothetical protein A3C53_08895 [Omnitrophica WOR_2 bacterium RIFCSPHIGHO2_02_FULL_68_15]